MLHLSKTLVLEYSRVEMMVVIGNSVGMMVVIENSVGMMVEEEMMVSVVNKVIEDDFLSPHDHDYSRNSIFVTL